MSKNDKEKALSAAKGFAAFCDQFGNDDSIYKRVLLEVFFEELMNGTSVSVSGETRQEGSENTGSVKKSEQVQSSEIAESTNTESSPEDAV